jgi:hypothetical protein
MDAKRWQWRKYLAALPRYSRPLCTMKLTRRLLLAFAALATTAFSADEEGFKPIFNGKDFTGWKGPVENYEVKDGAIA